MTDHADIKASTDPAWLRAQLGDEPMPDAEREAMEWLERCSGHPCAATLQRMLAARRFPARLYEEDAVAIAETVSSDGRLIISGRGVQTIWQAAYAHLAAPPTPKTVWVVRASFARPEARTTEDSYADILDARMHAADCFHRGAISLTITEEARPA